MEPKNKILNQLFSLQRFGIKPGLERTLNLLQEINNPHNKLTTIHVAGTNGKGSVCSMLSSILVEMGFKTGLYTSPHICQFNERIKVNGKEIGDEEMIAFSELLLPIANRIGCTFFEITTVMAFLYFYQKEVDIAVIETGMGGRYDSTNVLKPIITIITKISLDHQLYLGSKIEEIACEKAGIIKKNTPLILGKNDTKVLKVIENIAIKNNSEFYYAENLVNIKNVNYLNKLSMVFDSSIINIDRKKIEIKEIFLPLAGNHQLENFSIVLLGIYLLLDRPNSFDRLKILDNSQLEFYVRQGLKNLYKNTNLKGRIQLLQKEPPIIIDVAHNPDAINNLVQTLQDCGYKEKWNILFGVMADKDYRSMLETLKQICNSMIITQPKTNRALSIDILNQIAEEIGINVLYSTNSCKDALFFAMKQEKPLLIVGSFYLIEEVLESIKN